MYEKIPAIIGNILTKMDDSVYAQTMNQLNMMRIFEDEVLNSQRVQDFLIEKRH